MYYAKYISKNLYDCDCIISWYKTEEEARKKLEKLANPFVNGSYGCTQWGIGDYKDLEKYVELKKFFGEIDHFHYSDIGVRLKFDKRQIKKMYFTKYILKNANNCVCILDYFNTQKETEEYIKELANNSSISNCQMGVCDYEDFMQYIELKKFFDGIDYSYCDDISIRLKDGTYFTIGK